MNKVDYKKQFPDLYAPKNTPSVIDVPAMKFIMVNGKGNPNDEGGEYQKAVGLLYAFSFTIKMGFKFGIPCEGYYDYVVPPLEGLWWMETPTDMDFSKKEKYNWCSMIRQPDFITEEIFDQAKFELTKKKPELDVTQARFEVFTEGLCVQIMHHGPYDDEPAALEKLDAYINENGYINDIGNLSSYGGIRRHHEIYLSDPRKANPANLRTILRAPVKKNMD